jgi:hypothetical protein
VRQVPLTRGLWAIVDDGDHEAVTAAGPWYAADRLTVLYAARMVRRPDGRRTVQYMHQFLTDWPMTDHANADGLDNRRANLRPADHSQNHGNTRLQKNNTSGFKGVSWCKRSRRWRALINRNGRQAYLGVFATAEEAARTYDAAAMAAWGEYARPNFPKETR